jgi:hypothetical protein
VIRTQIQLTDEQARALREIARARGDSMAELIRSGVDEVLRSEPGPTREERKRRAIAASGKFRSGLSDISAEHDRYLGEAFAR